MRTSSRHLSFVSRLAPCHSMKSAYFFTFDSSTVSRIDWSELARRCNSEESEYSHIDWSSMDAERQNTKDVLNEIDSALVTSSAPLHILVDGIASSSASLLEHESSIQYGLRFLGSTGVLQLQT